MIPMLRMSERGVVRGIAKFRDSVKVEASKRVRGRDLKVARATEKRRGF